MALITCPECKKQISDTATSCPQCGFVITQEKVAEIKAAEEKVKKGCRSGCGLFLLGLISIAVIAALSLPSGSNKSSNIDTTFDKIAPFLKSQEYVQERLKSPTSAKFPMYRESFVRDLGGGKYAVASYVDSENSFGAKMRMKYGCVLSSQDGKTWTLEDLQFME